MNKDYCGLTLSLVVLLSAALGCTNPRTRTSERIDSRAGDNSNRVTAANVAPPPPPSTPERKPLIVGKDLPKPTSTAKKTVSLDDSEINQTNTEKPITQGSAAKTPDSLKRGSINSSMYITGPRG